VDVLLTNLHANLPVHTFELVTDEEEEEEETQTVAVAAAAAAEEQEDMERRRHHTQDSGIIHSRDRSTSDHRQFPSTLHIHTPGASTPTNAAAVAELSQPQETPISTFNVDSVEYIFGDPVTAAPASADALLLDHLGSPFSDASGNASTVPSQLELPYACACVPISFHEQHRVKLAEMALRIERAQRDVTDAKNAILKRKATTMLQALQVEQQALQASTAPPL
jgi:hypothetical protein